MNSSTLFIAIRKFLHVAGVFFGVLFASLQATTVTWDGESNANMGVGTNWNTNTTPVDLDDVIFGATGAGTLSSNLDTGSGYFWINTATFSGGTGYTINDGGVSWLVSGGITNSSASGVTHRINSSVLIDSNQTWTTSNSGSTMTLGNAFTFNATSTLTLSGSGNFTFVGGLQDGTVGVDVGTLVVGNSGTTTLMGSGNYTGTTTINSGSTLNIQHANALGGTAGRTSVINGGALEVQGNISVGNEGLTLNGSGINSGGALKNVSGTNSWSGNVSLGSTSTINTVAGKLTLSGVVSGSNNGVTKTGMGTLVLSGTNTYTGPTVISAGYLFVNGSLHVNSLVTVDAGATLGGSGNVQGTVTNNGQISPGAADPGIGNLSSGSQTWSDTALFKFEINDATGTAGTNWDKATITGGLDLSKISAGGFDIDIWTLNGSVTGLMSNFNSANNYAWTFVTTTTGITGFNSNLFNILTPNFANAIDGGAFAIAQNGNNLEIQYTSAVPEPKTWALIVISLVFFGSNLLHRKNALNA